ncbi:hypothetical protein FPV67DRAFT_1493564 [Lyophyllum atratum]|nr:hypothetical protein FPV67DRAFT_1493564 [Lyophyllum atratum]
MLLPLNAAYHFFAPKRNRQQPDPEKGPNPEPERVDNASSNPGNAPTAEKGKSSPRSNPGNAPPAEEGESSPASNDNDENEEDPTSDQDDDEIINELEREEYPDSDQPRRKRRLSGLSALSTSSWWSRTKGMLDPRTSETDLESYVPRYRYLPILAGVVIPFSILLEIPGLTEDWYIRTANGQTVEIRKNTAILDVGLAFSMAFAALANLCLIVRFMEKGIMRMTIFCVLFLTIHDIINIVTVTTFGVEHRFDDGFTYGQAFWLTVCSTAVSTLVNVTLIVDCIRTPDFATSGSGLTRKQRTLVISVITLLTYIALGALVETFLLELTFINALYFTVVTIETIGFGEIAPKSAGARGFTAIYAIIGIINLAVTVGLTREAVLEGVEVGYRKRLKAVRERRKRLQHERRVWSRWRSAVEWRLRSAGKPVWVKGSPRIRQNSCAFIRVLDRIWPTLTDEGLCREFAQYKHIAGYGHYPHPRGMRLNIEALSWPELEAAAMEAGVPLRYLLPEGFKPKKQKETKDKEKDKEKEKDHDNTAQIPGTNNPRIVPPELEGIPPTHARLGHMIVMLGNFALAMNQSSFEKVPKPGERHVRRGHKAARHKPQRTAAQQYQELRASVEQEEKWAFYVRLTLVLLVFFAFWTIGSAIFMTTEKWSYGTAIYFCFIAFTTIGYGDLTPQTPAGRAIFVFWALMGAGTMTILISILSEAWSSHYKNLVRPDIVHQTVNRYKERHRQPHPTSPSSTLAPTSPPDTGRTYVDASSPTTAKTSVEESQKRVDGHLKSFPERVLREARTADENVKYLAAPQAMDPHQESIPESLKQLMDEVAGVEKFAERVKDEILKDPNARHELLTISVEKALRTIMQIAEEAINAMRERERLNQLQEEVAQPGGDTSMQREQEHSIRRRQVTSPGPSVEAG